MSAAQCIRDVGNISVATDARFKVDNAEFDPVLFLSLLPTVAPKLIALIENIRKKDAADGGALFKHVIYVDNRSALYGARMIAGALTAAGFRSAIMRNTSIEPYPGPNAFAVLSATEFFGKSMGVTLKKQVLDVFNERPGNIHGERIRFMILDSSYREGIDLYDVKYLHIMEPLLSDAELRQVIGRSTRMCGQFGLEFNPDAGWPLHVTRYQLVFTGDLKTHYGVETLFDLYKQHIPAKDKKLAGLLDIMERAVQDAAVDKVLNAPIHDFSLKNARKPGAQLEAPAGPPKERKWQNLFGLIATPAFLKPKEASVAEPEVIVKEPEAPEAAAPEPEIAIKEPEPELSMGVQYSEPTPEIPLFELDKIPEEPEAPAPEPEIAVKEPEAPAPEPEIAVKEPEAPAPEPEIAVKEPELGDIRVKILGGSLASLAPPTIMNNAQMTEFINKNYMPAFKWPEPLLENTCTEKKFMKAIKPIDLEELEAAPAPAPVPREDLSQQIKPAPRDFEESQKPQPQFNKPRKPERESRDFEQLTHRPSEPRPQFNPQRNPREQRPQFNPQRKSRDFEELTQRPSEPHEPRRPQFNPQHKPREYEEETPRTPERPEVFERSPFSTIDDETYRTFNTEMSTVPTRRVYRKTPFPQQSTRTPNNF